MQEQRNERVSILRTGEEQGLVREKTRDGQRGGQPSQS